MPKKFRIVRRKKIRQYRDDSRDEDQMMAEDVRSDEPIALSVAVDEPIIAAEAEAIVQIEPKKRGRKSKNKNDADNPSQMGRPPLARDALVVSPRRSSRLKK